MNEFDRELQAAHALARRAATLVLEHRRAGVHVEHKADNEPVTEADRAANDLIVRELQREFPGDAILSEEAADDGTRVGARRVWMVDPIDGTNDFILGDDGFAVMIGLLVEGRPSVGVVCQPTSGIAWAGVVGEGAWQENASGQRSPLRTSSLAAGPGIRLVASKTHRTGDVDRLRRALDIRDEMNVGGVGLKVAMVADGTRDVYVYPGTRTKLWDTCAPEAILVAAGGRLTDVFGAPLDYTGSDLQNRRGILASNGPLHDLVRQTLADLR